MDAQDDNTCCRQVGGRLDPRSLLDVMGAENFHGGLIGPPNRSLRWGAEGGQGAVSEPCHQRKSGSGIAVAYRLRMVEEVLPGRRTILELNAVDLRLRRISANTACVAACRHRGCGPLRFFSMVLSYRSSTCQSFVCLTLRQNPLRQCAPFTGLCYLMRTALALRKS